MVSLSRALCLLGISPPSGALGERWSLRQGQQVFSVLMLLLACLSVSIHLLSHTCTALEKRVISVFFLFERCSQKTAVIFLSIERSNISIKIKKISMIIKTNTWFHQRPPREKTGWGEKEKSKTKRGKKVLLVSSSGALGEAPGMAAVPVCVWERQKGQLGGGKGSDCTPLSPLQPHTDTFTQTYTQQQQQQLNTSTAQPWLPRSHWRHRQSDSSEICPVTSSDGGSYGA